jgi:hypothetical protein
MTAPSAKHREQLDSGASIQRGSPPPEASMI